MGVLLNRRRYMGGGSALPYDAEIEYLQNTGYQYIDTGINPDATTIFTLDAQYTQSSNYNADNGLMVGSRFHIGVFTNKFYFGCRNDYLTTISYDTNRHFFELSGDGTAKVDETSYTVSTQPLSTMSNPIYLYARNNGNNVSQYINGFKIFRCLIKKDGVLVRDFIPVRKGTTGYLYDKVSGQLFGNVGTGSFTLGQDIVPIEYIQSSNTQWIDTGFKPNQDTSVYMTVLIPASNIVSRFYETRNSMWNGEYALINFGQSDNQFQIRFGNYSRGTRLRNKLDINTIYKLFMDKNSVYLDDTLIGTAQAYTFQCNYNLSLFALNNAGTVTPASDCTYRLYDCKIYDNSVLIRDYIPVRVGTTGYLLDKLTHTLYSNSGTGDFILGNDL